MGPGHGVGISPTAQPRCIPSLLQSRPIPLKDAAVPVPVVVLVPYIHAPHARTPFELWCLLLLSVLL